MEITLTPDLERLIYGALANGRYGSVEDVLSAALCALDRQETLAALKEGLEDIEAGRVCTLDDADEEFRRKYGVSR